MQVEDLERLLKCKLRPRNAYLSATLLELFLAYPREVYEIKRVLCDPALMTSRPGATVTTYVISNDRLAAVWEYIVLICF